jgi:MFS family permease
MQGIGGAMMVPVGRLAVLHSTEKHELIGAIATITWPGLAAPVLGPPLGGFISTYASWHWIFFLNVPLGLVAFVLALRLMPKEKQLARKPFDGVGFVLMGLACFALMYSLDLVSRDGSSWPLASLLISGALAAGGLGVLHARHRKSPLVDLKALNVHTLYRKKETCGAFTGKLKWREVFSAAQHPVTTASGQKFPSPPEPDPCSLSCLVSRAISRHVSSSV